MLHTQFQGRSESRAGGRRVGRLPRETWTCPARGASKLGPFIDSGHPAAASACPFGAARNGHHPAAKTDGCSLLQIPYKTADRVPWLKKSVAAPGLDFSICRNGKRRIAQPLGNRGQMLVPAKFAE